MSRQEKLGTLISFAGILMGAVVLYSLGMTGLVLVKSNHLVSNYFYFLLFLMPPCFIILPNSISKRYELYSKEAEVRFSLKQFLVLFLILFVLNHFVIKGEEFWHQMLIATCEEFLFRYCLYHILRKNFTRFTSLLLCSLAFGVILHLNYSLLDNLLIRSSVGFLLGAVSLRFGLQASIISHWFLNLLAAIFS